MQKTYLADKRVFQAMSTKKKREKKNGTSNDTRNTCNCNSKIVSNADNNFRIIDILNNANKLRCYDWVMLAIAGLTLIATMFIGYYSFKLSARNQPLVIENIELIDLDSEHYSVEVNKIQDEVKEVYLAYPDNDKLYYFDLQSPSHNNIIIDKKIVDNETIKITSEDGIPIPLIGSDEGDVIIYDIVQFALVLLDYSGNWNCYYVLIKPKISFSTLRMLQLVISDGNDSFTFETHGNFVAPQRELIINTSLLNEETLEQTASAFTSNSTTICEWVPSTDITQVVDEAQYLNYPLGEKTILIDIPYSQINSISIYNTISEIYGDIRFSHVK